MHGAPCLFPKMQVFGLADPEVSARTLRHRFVGYLPSSDDRENMQIN